MRPSVSVITDPDLVIDNLTGLRRRILELLTEPDSATGLARRLDVSRQKVNYHLRMLEEAGFVELVEERPRRGLNERIVRRTSDVVMVDPLAFDASGLTRSDLAGVSGVVATATDFVRHAAAVTVGASETHERVAAAAVETEIRVSSPQALRALLDEMGELLARYDSDTGLRVRFAGLVLPAGDDQ